MKEKELTDKIIDKLAPYFLIYSEFKGEFKHWDQKRIVRLDLGLYPKKETIEKGFPRFFFGIEVKHFNLHDPEWTVVKKTKNLIHQCITYKVERTLHIKS